MPLDPRSLPSTSLFLLLACVLLSSCASRPVQESGEISEPAPVLGPLEESGELGGAAFRIDIPENWNGDLVMLLRGFVRPGTPPELAAYPLPITQGLLANGYAVATTGYRRQGWAAPEGVDDAERLRSHFVERFGPPRRSLVVGYSMGSLIALASVERFPDSYDGALALCGINASLAELLHERIFPVLLAFDHYFPGVLPLGEAGLADMEAPANAPLSALDHNYNVNRERVSEFASEVGVPPLRSMGLVAHFFRMLRSVQDMSGGHPIDNRDTFHTGMDDEIAFNQTVRRYSADPEAAARIHEQDIVLQGTTPVPVLMLNNPADAAVPAAISERYLMRARFAGNADRIVTRWSSRSGHCRMQPEEVLQSLADLVAWIDSGERPASGAVVTGE